MTDNHDLSDWLRLSAVPGLGAESQRSLLAAFGLPQQVFMAGRTALAGVVGKARADAVLAAPNQEAIERALAWAQEPGNHILSLADDAYPRALLDIPDPPLLLYVKGTSALLQRPALAIVGARSSSAHGEANAEAFARHLASQGFTIVSGLAAAARKGILVKGGVYLESGHKLDFLALDKTGTITHGKPVQTDYLPLDPLVTDSAVLLAASLASRSDHPVSLAVANAAVDKNLQ